MLLALASWAMTHSASGVEVAVAGVRGLMSRHGRSRRYRRAFVMHFRVPHIADVTNDLRERLISLVAGTSGHAVVQGWLGRAMDDSTQDVACPELLSLIRRLAWSFDDALQSLVWNKTQTLPAPASLLEAQAARVLDAALAALDDASLRSILGMRREGLSMLQQAALSGAAAHALVLRYHSRRVGMESEMLAARAKSKFRVHSGLTAGELAATSGHCSTAQELGSPQDCPQRFLSAPLADAAAWSAMPQVRAWPSTWSHESDWDLPQECEISSLAFSSSTNWREVLQNHSLMNRPLRVTGVGSFMAAKDSSLFSFASADKLMRRPWGKLRYEVGDIPYAANFRRETPVMMDLRDYVQAMNRSDLGPSAYWFSEHEAKQQPHKKDDITIMDRRAGKHLERLRRALFSALLLDAGAEEDQTVQFTLGPPLTGSPVHFHAAALNLVVMGGKRWALLPLDGGHWSHLPLRLWQARGLPPGALQCLQRPGDALFVPRASTHGTVNVANTIAVSWLLYKEAAALGLASEAV